MGTVTDKDVKCLEIKGAHAEIQNSKKELEKEAQKTECKQETEYMREKTRT